MDRFEYKTGTGGGGVLHAESVPVEDIAARFGTPTYVYSRATLIDHYDKIAAAFGDLSPLICYSIKSCPNIHVCRVLAERGSGMDVVSGGELERAWLAGCPMDRVVYAGVGKTEPEIRAALDGRFSPLRGGASAIGNPIAAGVESRGPIGYFNIESEPEFETVARVAREMGVVAHGALRINPDVDPKTHAYTATGKKETKFGVGIDRALQFFEQYGRDASLRLDALHLHIGSPVYDTAPYVAAIEKTVRLIDDLESRGHRIAMLDVGGGFGADYETAKSPLAVDYATVIVPLLRDRARKGLRIILEPGRSIVANAGILLTRVLYVKEGGSGKRFLICDAGMNTLIRPALYGSFHFVWPARVEPGFVPTRRAERVDMPGLSPADVVGPICESGDFIAKDRALPPVRAGDLIAVFTAGAYGMAMASRYNSHPFPAEVMVDGTNTRAIRPRETMADVLAPELG